MSIIINIVLILVSLVLIVAVLMQEGNKEGLGAIGGAAETFLGKNKSKSYEGKLLLITKIGCVVFVVIAILATWYNARTYTVTYYVQNENGEQVEYFPAVETSIQGNLLTLQLQGYTPSAEDEAAIRANYEGLSVKEKRASYAYGDEIYQYSVPELAGKVGEWDKTLPKTMDRKNYTLTAQYTDGYILSLVAVIPLDETAAEDATASEAEAEAEALTEYREVLYSKTYLANADIPVASVSANVPAPTGYETTWSEEIPAVMPEHDVTIEILYTAVEEEPADEDATPEEPEANASESEPVEAETTEPEGEETAEAPVTPVEAEA